MLTVWQLLGWVPLLVFVLVWGWGSSRDEPGSALDAWSRSNARKHTGPDRKHSDTVCHN